MNKSELIKYFQSLGLEVRTSTKARGHQGFFFKNRIDISKNTPENKIVSVLIHEFAHYIHSKIEPDINKTGGTLQKIFQSDNPIYKSELIKVTNFVDENSLCIRLYEHKDRVKAAIKEQEAVIKSYFPNFQRSKKFKEFDRYIKKSNARYFLKYDAVKVVEYGFFTQKIKTYTLNNLSKDFPDMPKAFAACLKLKSLQRKQSKISARINRYKKYYERPTELFARFVEGLFADSEWTQALAPNTSRQFFNLLQSGYYMELENIISNQALQKNV